MSELELNSLISRFRKFLVLLAATTIEVATVLGGGPSWLYTATAIAGTVLVVLVPNEPKYKELSEKAKEISERAKSNFNN